jgi:hypothetical protein
MCPRLADSDIVTVSSGPGISAPDRAIVKDVVKITKNSTIYNLGPFPFYATRSCSLLPRCLWTIFRWSLLMKISTQAELKKE